ncbi:GNAT family N-acetyltransferase [Nocardia vinacea]|uniref:GNAT family N-acetyltransferase n=1 Tax=Nocardia vinacea TaxID=96468 RepID=UPI0033ED8519
MIDVQVLRPDDWPIWRQLRRQALRDAPEAFGSTLADWSGPGDDEARWRARLADVAFNVIIRWRGVAAGMVSADMADTGRIELMSMWVAPFARGRGVGDAAIRAVLHWANGREVGLSVKVDNQAAIRLYRRHGFADAACSPGDTASGRMLKPASMNPPDTW